MDPLEQRIALRLEALRRERGLSLDEVAQTSCVSRATLSRIERGESSPTAGVLGKLCTAYGLTMSQLLLDVEEDAPSLIRRAEAFRWHDPETGFARTSISPPQPGYQVELIWAELPAGARIEYEAPPVRGLEQHLLLLAGELKIDCAGKTYALAGQDCLRFHLTGATAFESTGAQTATYVLAIRRPA